MKPETKLVLILFLIGILLSVVGYNLTKVTSSKNFVSPFSNTTSIFSFLQGHEKPKKIIYGYLPYWTLDKIDNLQLDKLTDIAYFGLYLEADGNFTKSVEGSDGYTITEQGLLNWEDNEELDKLISKCKKRDVRFALTVIAHFDEKNDVFLDCKECWTTLLNNLKKELDIKGIKDVNLNFEYYGQTEEDKAEKFAEFTKFLNEELDKTYGESYLVVSAFADSAQENRVSSKLDKIGRYADGIFVMAYDFHRPQSESVGPVTPVEGPGFDLMEMLDDQLAEIPPNKIILGLPYYGYNWLVEDETPYAMRVEGSDENGFSKSQAYEDVMETILEIKPDLKWNEEGQAPYFTYISPETGQMRTVYYENEQSLAAKYDLIISHNLAGVGIWALGYDGGYTELWDLLYDKFIK